MSTISKYTIKDLEVLTNIKSHTIRIWEKRYEILSPARTDTNIRHYNNDDLRRLLNVSILNQGGYKISKIAKMPDLQMQQLIQEITMQKADNANLVDGLIIGMMDLNEHHLNEVFDAAVGRIGFEKTIGDVVFPFFHRIGIMWQIGAINPAQEHFFSQFIRQKIIAATETLNYQPDQKLPKIVLFLPEAELHEFGLLLYNYALRARDYATIYLSQAVPIDSISRIVEITSPDILVCSITSAIETSLMADNLDKLSESFNGKIYISGRFAEAYAQDLPRNIMYFDNLNSLLNIIAETPIKCTI